MLNDDDLSGELEKFVADEVAGETKGSDVLEIDCSEMLEYGGLFQYFSENPEDVIDEIGNMLDTEVKIRPTNIPENICDVSIQDLGVEHSGQLVRLRGVLQTATDPKGKCKVAAFMCERCGQNNLISQDFEDGVEKPQMCQNPNCGEKGPFSLMEDDSTFEDYQFVDIQEKPSDIDGSRQARSKLVYLEGSDMMDKIDPGQDIILVGVPTLVREKQSGKKSNSFNVWIKGLSIRVDEEEYYAKELSDRDKEKILGWKERVDDVSDRIVESVAPEIENSPEILKDVKKAVTLQLVGCSTSSEDRRSTINLLLCGDPGVSKTRLARKSCDLRPRSKYVSGSRASGPGLTASVVRDERTGEWLLKAGSLVLASGSVLAIDDYEQMDENKGHLLEAMSIGKISISKVINRTLPAETSVLALANPEYGRFDRSKDLHKQLPTEPAEHSRYDLIFAIMDEVSEERDSTVGDKIYDNWMDGDSSEDCLDREMLKKIVAFVRSIDPVLPESGKERLKEFYTDIRSKTSVSGSTPFTPRYFESMIRLAKANARLRFSDRVEKVDIDESIRLMRSSLDSLGFSLDDSSINDLGALDTGISRAQKDKIDTLWGVIRDLSDGGDVPVSVGSFKEEAEGVGIDGDFVSEFLDREIEHNGSLVWHNDSTFRVLEEKWGDV